MRNKKILTILFLIFIAGIALIAAGYKQVKKEILQAHSSPVKPAAVSLQEQAHEASPYNSAPQEDVVQAIPAEEEDFLVFTEFNEDIADITVPMAPKEKERAMMEAFITPYKIKSGIVSTVLAQNPQAMDDKGNLVTLSKVFITSLTTDPQGNLYISDNKTRGVYSLEPNGTLKVVAARIGEDLFPEQYSARKAIFYYITADDTNIYTADSTMNRVFKVNKTSGAVSLFAGNGEDRYRGDGMSAVNSALGNPQALAAGNGSVFITSNSQARIREVNAKGIITTAAGNGSSTFQPLENNQLAAAASIGMPVSLEYMSDGSLIVANSEAKNILKITPEGKISTLLQVKEDPYATGIVLKNISAVSADSNDNIFILDFEQSAIFMLDPKGNLYFAGGNKAVSGIAEDGEESINANMGSITNIAADKDGNIYLSASVFENGAFANKIRKITFN